MPVSEVPKIIVVTLPEKKSRASLGALPSGASASSLPPDRGVEQVRRIKSPSKKSFLLQMAWSALVATAVSLIPFAGNFMAKKEKGEAAVPSNTPVPVEVSPYRERIPHEGGSSLAAQILLRNGNIDESKLPKKLDLATRLALEATRPDILRERYGITAPVSSGTMSIFLSRQEARLGRDLPLRHEVRHEKEGEVENERDDLVLHARSSRAPLLADPTEIGEALLYVKQALFGLSNETTIAMHPRHPDMVLVSANDYSAEIQDYSGEFRHLPIGFLLGSGDGAQHFQHTLISPDLDRRFPLNGDMILRPAPDDLTTPRGVNFYGAEMAFTMDFLGNPVANGLKVFTVNLSSNGQFQINPEQLQMVVSHQSYDSPFEDKENLAVDLDRQSPTYGLRALTNTQFQPEGPSRINVYFMNREGTVIRKVEGISTSSDNVQWSAPIFGRGGSLDIPYRDFHDNTIYNVAFHDPGAAPGEPQAIAHIGRPVERYFGFRALSGPSSAAYLKDGSKYVVYDDADSGKSQTYLVRFDPVANRWLAPVQIPADPDLDHWMSSVAVDPNTGVIAVTYRALRADGDLYERKGVLSFDGGKSWTDPINFSLHPSRRTRDGWGGNFSGDYEETAIGSRQDEDGNVLLSVLAPHGETSYRRFITDHSVHVGTLKILLSPDDLEAARKGNEAANLRLKQLLSDALRRLEEARRVVITRDSLFA